VASIPHLISRFAFTYIGNSIEEGNATTESAMVGDAKFEQSTRQSSENAQIEDVEEGTAKPEVAPEVAPEAMEVAEA